MISVIISARNAARPLAATLMPLIPPADRRRRPASHRCRRPLIRQHGEGRRRRWRRHRRRALEVAALNWRTARREHAFLGFYFLMPDTVLEDGWEQSATTFMRRVDCGERGAWPPGAFTLRLDDTGLAPRSDRALVQLRCKIWRRPYGDQGLLIPRQLFDAVGGYKNLPDDGRYRSCAAARPASACHARRDRRDIGRTLQTGWLSTSLDAQSAVPGALRRRVSDAPDRAALRKNGNGVVEFFVVTSWPLSEAAIQGTRSKLQKRFSLSGAPRAGA